MSVLSHVIITPKWHVSSHYAQIGNVVLSIVFETIYMEHIENINVGPLKISYFGKDHVWQQILIFNLRWQSRWLQIFLNIPNYNSWKVSNMFAVSPGHQHLSWKWDDIIMLLTLWMDLWPVNVLADVSSHHCPSISMTCWIMMPTKMIVILTKRTLTSILT